MPILGRLRHRGGGRSRVWGWILDRVLARPLVSAGAAAALLVALALPGARDAHDARRASRACRPTSPVRGDLRARAGRVPRHDRARARSSCRPPTSPSPEVRAGIADLRGAGRRDRPDVRADRRARQPGARRWRSSSSRCTAPARPTRRSTRRSPRCATTSSRRRSARCPARR